MFDVMKSPQRYEFPETVPTKELISWKNILHILPMLCFY